MSDNNGKANPTALKAAAERYPKLSAALNKIESASHALELTDGRYAYLKYLDRIYRFYWKSKERGTRKRDRIRICKLRGLNVREGACLFGVLILATTDVTKSTRGKYVARLRDAAKANVVPEDIRTFLRRPGRKGARRKQHLLSNVPRLRLVQ
jgi:hypothetical protein